DLLAWPAAGLRADFRPGAEPLYRLLHFVLRHRHRAFPRARRSDRAARRLAHGVSAFRARPASRGRARVRLCRAFAKTSFGREIFFLEDAVSSRCLAARSGEPPCGRLHARLRSALPRAVRLARLDGGISRLLLGLSRECKLSA